MLGHVKSKNAVHGVLLVDKPIGATSNAVLQQVKYFFNARKAGHTGTLDPLASGLLPICFGEATKFSRFLLDADKNYIVSMQLGVQTTTGDSEGEVIARKQVPLLSPHILMQIVNQFKGTIEQLPSMYSAIKYQGKPLYKYARKGIAVKRKIRKVIIHDLQLLSFSGPIVSLSVTCSKGTYIRTLVEDIGEKLGCGAHVISLRRLVSGSFEASQMINYDKIQQLAEQKNQASLQKMLLPISSMVTHLPSIKLDSPHSTLICDGNKVELADNLPCGWTSIFSSDNHFLGVGQILEGGKLAPTRMLSPQISKAKGHDSAYGTNTQICIQHPELS